MHSAHAVTTLPENFTVEMNLPPADEGAIAAHALVPPTPEQLRAVEAHFARQHESAAVHGLLGLWTGTALLRDLTVEHFDRDPREEEEREDKGGKER